MPLQNRRYSFGKSIQSKLIVFFSIFTIYSTVGIADSFSQGISHNTCVSYETSKEMFKLKQVSVIGRTCRVSIRILPKTDKFIPIEVLFDSKDLESGSSPRDKEVVKILGDRLLYKLNIPTALWEQRKAQKQFSIQGNLLLKTGEYSVAFTVSKQNVDDSKFSGIYKGKFSDFGMQPPRVGPGGFVSDVSEDLTLRFDIDLIE